MCQQYWGIENFLQSQIESEKIQKGHNYCLIQVMSQKFNKNLSDNISKHCEEYCDKTTCRIGIKIKYGLNAMVTF